MLLLNVQGLSNGKHFVETKGKADGVLKSVMIDAEITVKGTLLVHNERLILKGKAKTEALLVCDLSMEKFREEIETDLEINILKGVKEEYRNEVDENTIYIGEEDKQANITEIVLQELLVKVPMKKVAPEYRDKDLDEIYPSLNKNESNEGLSPFDVLKKLNSNKN